MKRPGLILLVIPALALLAACSSGNDKSDGKSSAPSPPESSVIASADTSADDGSAADSSEISPETSADISSESSGEKSSESSAERTSENESSAESSDEGAEMIYEESYIPSDDEPVDDTPPTLASVNENNYIELISEYFGIDVITMEDWSFKSVSCETGTELLKLVFSTPDKTDISELLKSYFYTTINVSDDGNYLQLIDPDSGNAAIGDVCNDFESFSEAGGTDAWYYKYQGSLISCKLSLSSNDFTLTLERVE